jgi:hypothetical protein
MFEVFMEMRCHGSFKVVGPVVHENLSSELREGHVYSVRDAPASTLILDTAGHVLTLSSRRVASYYITRMTTDGSRPFY